MLTHPPIRRAVAPCDLWWWAAPSALRRPVCAAVSFLFILTALVLFSPELWAQSAGQAEVALQGYYLGGNQQSLQDESGLAVTSSQFFPGLGLFSSSAEGYGSDGFRTGNVFGSLQGVPLMGWHWDFVGGDFQFSSSPIVNPFTNIYIPQISARGARIVMKRPNRSYQIFAGEETLLGGPRIPYRIVVPQRIIGASLDQKLGKRWEFAARFMNLATSPSAFVNYSSLFAPGQDYQGSNSLILQSSFAITSHLKFFSEGGYGTVTPEFASPVPQKPLSFLAGPSWESDKFSFRANYVLQSTSYMPLLGYAAGDRKGPYAELRYQPLKRLEVYGSTSDYSNNLEGNPDVPTFHSSGYTAGGNLLLPWKFNFGSSISSLHFSEVDPPQPGQIPSDNRQLSVSLSRPIGRHSLRLSAIDMTLNSNFQLQKQRFVELGDTFAWKIFVIGGSVREQNSESTVNTNTMFFQGSLAINLKRVSLYGYVEQGNDLVNRSVFSTNAYNSTVVGATVPLWSWSMQAELLRNTLNTALNPENIFLFASAGLAPNTQLAVSSQWSVYVRISKEFHWGKAMPVGSSIEQYAEEHAPLVGNIQGTVFEQSLEGPHPAANVAVSLDGGQDSVTDDTGQYKFTSVAVGPHRVALDLDQLPADYDPGTLTSTLLSVEPRGTSRADFSVIRLTDLTGKIVAPAGVAMESIVIRLKGTSRYTTPDDDGSFGFSNVAEGAYEVVIDEQTLPEGFLLASPASMQVRASASNPATAIEFDLRQKPPEQVPIHQMLQEQIHIGPSAK